MRHTLVGQHIRRGTRNLFLVNALLLAGVVAMFALGANYWVNFFAGPFEMDREAVAALPNADGLSRYYVRLTGDQLLKTGLQEVEGHKDQRTGKLTEERVTADFSALVFRDRCLVVKLGPNAAQDRSVVGKLVAIPPDVRGRIVLPAEQQLQRPGLFLPVMLDATGFRGPGYWMLGLGVPAGLLAVWNLSRAAARSADPEKHPVARQLLKYGVPAEVAERIDAEGNTPGECRNVGKATLTKSWLLVPHTYGVRVRHLGDAVWSYKCTTQHRVNGVPTGKTYSAICHFKDGAPEKVQVKTEQMAEEFVKAAWERVPWMFVGYNPQLESAWKKKRGEVLAALEGRKQELLARAAQEPPTVEAAE
ncbi:MAG TPA: DUF6709 family protein [Gemmataceae bacterium]|jgi:hypothetical protein